jgi:hypothetical protein
VFACHRHFAFGKHSNKETELLLLLKYLSIVGIVEGFNNTVLLQNLTSVPGFVTDVQNKMNGKGVSLWSTLKFKRCSCHIMGSDISSNQGE